MDISQELDEKFAKLDDLSKLTIMFQIFSQCACSHRRFVGLGQMKHGRDYVASDAALATAERIDPSVVASIQEIRAGIEKVEADLPDYLTAEFGPSGPASTRDFLWADAFEEPVWFDIRHAARSGLSVSEGYAREQAPA